MNILKSQLFSFEWFPFLTKVILFSRLSWSIRVRWLAVSGYFIATLISSYTLDLVIPYDTIWILVATLSFINLIYYIILKLVKQFTFKGELIFLQTHIFIDLLFLTLLLHYSGGIENPVFLFYVFHVVISSIIFPGMIPAFVASFAVILLSLLVYLEYNGIISHYCIFETGVHENLTLIFLTLIIFTITVFVIMYICTTFMRLFRDIKRQIDEKNHKLTEMDKQKSQFFMFSSHELKSPIVAIKSSIDGVLQNYKKQLDSRGSNILQRASVRSQQMLNIITEMIYLSRNRIDLVDAEQDDLDLLAILNEVIEQEHSHADSKYQKVKTNFPAGPVCIKGIKEDFRKVFGNLLSNAIRYTDEKGVIEINARADTNNFWIDFTDNGIGIPEKDLNKVFHEFYRAENAKRLITFGTGLGLSLVQQIIKNYRGDITVKSELGKGTTFSIHLPLEGEEVR
jgi:signal transduction histidine kinase